MLRRDPGPDLGCRDLAVCRAGQDQRVGWPTQGKRWLANKKLIQATECSNWPDLMPTTGLYIPMAQCDVQQRLCTHEVLVEWLFQLLLVPRKLPLAGVAWNSNHFMYTLLYFTWLTNKFLLYNTGNSSQCYVAAWMGGQFVEEWIHVYIWLNHSAETWNYHNIVNRLYTN